MHWFRFHFVCFFFQRKNSSVNFNWGSHSVRATGPPRHRRMTAEKWTRMSQLTQGPLHSGRTSGDDPTPRGWAIASTTVGRFPVLEGRFTGASPSEGIILANVPTESKQNCTYFLQIRTNQRICHLMNLVSDGITILSDIVICNILAVPGKYTKEVSDIFLSIYMLMYLQDFFRVKIL